jgi:predicted SAM-dependent methyltransferase
LRFLRVLNEQQAHFASVASSANIEWANADRRLPLSDHSVDVLYTSHMLEHLQRAEAVQFLGEARRVLRSGGVIRIAVPDLARYVRHYLSTGDANAFVRETGLASSAPRTVLQRLGRVVMGERHHHWLYDGPSLCQLLAQCGFDEATVLAPGSTRISDPGPLNLTERADDSVCVEGVRP